MTKNNEICVLPLPDGPWISNRSPRFNDDASSWGDCSVSGASFLLELEVERKASREGINVGPGGFAVRCISDGLRSAE